MSDTIVYKADLTEFNAALDQVMVNTEVVLDDVIETEAEGDRVKIKVDSLVNESQISYSKILMGARRTAMIVRGLAIASGNAFAEIFTIGIEIALLTAELLIDVATAESMTVVGAVSAVAKIGIIMALLKKARQLQSGQTEAAARTEGTISALSALTFKLAPSPALLFMIIRRIFQCL